MEILNGNGNQNQMFDALYIKVKFNYFQLRQIKRQCKQNKKLEIGKIKNFKNLKGRGSKI